MDPNNTIGSAITRRSNKVGDIVSVEKDVWGLREWYPDATIEGPDQGGDLTI